MTSRFRKRCWILALAAAIPAAAGSPDPVEPLLRAWLAASTNRASFRSDLTQTRHLKTLTHPLTSTGRVWFQAPSQFRWELGDPPQSIALRSGDSMMVLSPRLRRAEVYTLGSSASGPAKDLMGLLDAAFPRSLEELRAQFDVEGVTTNRDRLELILHPRSPMARKLMPALTIGLDAATQELRSTELSMADGSRLRNEFHGFLTNAPVSAELFQTNLDSSWTITRNDPRP